MTEPTDAELDELRQANSGRLNFVTLSEFRTIARAVLAKWGTPPAVAGEPVAWMGTCDKTDLYYRKPPQADVVPLYATPQPTQAQAGAVPLDEARRLFDAGWKAAALFCDREDVVADGIIGFGACPQFEAAFSAAHGIGIKGGQHGTE